MKKLFLNLFSFTLLLFFVFSFVNADYNQTIFYEDFNDENLNETYIWKINNNAYYFIDGKLNSDGKKIDNTDRYLNQFDYFFNFSSNNIEFSFDALLKSNGNPQQGRGAIFSIVGKNGIRYDLRIQNGFTSNFNINKQSLSFGYGTDALYDYITTNFVPEYDKFYNLKAIRQNKTWFFYIDNNLIGQHYDNLELTNFSQIHIPSVGSVVIDNLKVISLDSFNEINETNFSEVNETTNQTGTNNLDDGLIRNSPVFYLHPNEYYEPREIYSMLNNSNLKKVNQIIKQKPIFYKDIENLSSSYFLDLTNVDITDFNYPPIKDFENFKPVVYGRAISFNNRKHYQYFIFYPFQKRGLMSHEGDLELIQVNEDGSGKIESVEYFFDLWKIVYYDLNLITFINKTHPVVYVALGSHNNYANNDEIDFQNPYMYFQKFLSKIKGLEKISSNGTIYKPEVLKKESINETNVVFYEVKDINEIPLTFKGYYGEISELVLRQPPKGPSENPRFWRKWNEPENYAYNPELPFFSVFLYSPVNFEIYKTKNNDLILINETNENLIFLNEEPKAAIVKGNEFKLKLKAYENGQFSLDVFLYDNETEKGIMISYKNITTLNCSNGYLDANFDSNFVLYYDSDCNNLYEIYLPNENTTMNYEYILPDKDNDTIIDFFDNCVDIFNPDQNDFNNDSLGDECDNPRYYKLKALSFSEQENENYKKKVNLAINYSLKDNYWINDFKPNTIKVFLYELFAVQHTNNTEIVFLLAKADKLIVENLLYEKEKDYMTKKKKCKNIIAIKEYEKALNYYEKKDYKKAILNFMHAWLVLN